MISNFSNWLFKSEWRRFYREVYLPADRILSEAAGSDLPTDVNQFIKTKTGFDHDYKGMITNLVRRTMSSGVAAGLDLDDAVTTITSEIMFDLHKQPSSLVDSFARFKATIPNESEYERAVLGVIGQAIKNKLVDIRRKSGGRWVESIWNRLSNKNDFSGFPDQDKAKDAYAVLTVGGRKPSFREKSEFIVAHGHRDIPRSAIPVSQMAQKSDGSSRTMMREPGVIDDPSSGMRLSELQKKIIEALTNSRAKATKENQKQNFTLAIKMVQDDLIGEDVPSTMVIQKYKALPDGSFPLGFQVTENRVRQAMKEIPNATLSVLQSMGDVYNLRKFSSAVAEEEDED